MIQIILIWPCRSAMFNCFGNKGCYMINAISCLKHVVHCRKGVRGHEVKCRSRIIRSRVRFPGAGVFWDFHWPTHSARVLV